MATFSIPPGRWLGRGSFLHKGQSLATQIECHFDVLTESVGAHLKGTQTLRDGSAPHAFACWITANDTGTYELAAQFGAFNLTGSAKLESFPNLGMLWSKEGDLQVAFSLFELRAGRGFRGFCRAGDSFLSWEIMLEPHSRAAAKASPNVIAIDPRKRRR
jgi:hypothetical protein